jgi:hypothetical protein
MVLGLGTGATDCGLQKPKKVSGGVPSAVVSRAALDHITTCHSVLQPPVTAPLTQF